MKFKVFVICPLATAVAVFALPASPQFLNQGIIDDAARAATGINNPIYEQAVRERERDMERYRQQQEAAERQRRERGALAKATSLHTANPDVSAPAPTKAVKKNAKRRLHAR